MHLIPHLGHLQLRQLNRGTFSALYAELSETGRADGRGGLSPRSVRAVHVTAHKALKDAVKDNLLARNPTDDANVPAKVRSQTPSWTAEQVGGVPDVDPIRSPPLRVPHHGHHGSSAF